MTVSGENNISLFYALPDHLHEPSRVPRKLEPGRAVDIFLIEEGNKQDVQDRMLVSFLQAFMKGEFNVITRFLVVSAQI